MLDPHWVFAGAALDLVGSVRYAVAITRGSVRPNLVTWSLWAAAPLIGFFAQLDSGVGLPAVMTLAAGVGPVIVVLTSTITRRHHAHLGVFDLSCGVISLAALGVWLGLGDAPLAVLVAVAADAVAALPTIIKAWLRPDSESALFYFLVGTGSTITLLTITSWTLRTWAFVGYQLALCVLLVAIITARRAPVPRHG